MTKILRSRPAFAVMLSLAAVALVPAQAPAPHVLAITGARIVPVAGAPLDAATLVVRAGVIEAVGTSVPVPPGAQVIEAKGLTVYPGLIDLGSTAGLDLRTPAEPSTPRTRLEVERWKRQVLLRPQVEAADHVRGDAPELTRLAAAGITSVLAVPPGSVVRGRSSLLNVAAPDDSPQIGNLADERRGRYVVKTPVAFHVEFAGRAPGDAYPASLMGVIGFVRQAFADARHYRTEQTRYEQRKGPRPVHDASLAALEPALAGRLPVAFQADGDIPILRALAFAKEFGLDPIVVGAHGAEKVTADLGAHRARVIYSLNLPARPRTLAPDADEPVETLRARAEAPKAPAALARAGIRFGFTSAGLREPRDFVRNAAKVVKAGLPAEAALRALTLDAATIAGVADRLGSIEKGKIANLILTDGDLFAEKTVIKHVVVDGHLVDSRQQAAGGRQ